MFSGWKARGCQGWEKKELPDVGELLHEGDGGGQQQATALEQHPVEVTTRICWSFFFSGLKECFLGKESQQTTKLLGLAAGTQSDVPNVNVCTSFAPVLTQIQKWLKFKNDPNSKMTLIQKWPKFINDPNKKLPKLKNYQNLKKKILLFKNFFKLK